MNTKVIKVSAKSTKNWLFRSFFTKSMDQVVEQWTRKGYTLTSTTPVTGAFGRTTHYLLTFQKK